MGERSRHARAFTAGRVDKGNRQQPGRHSVPRLYPVRGEGQLRIKQFLELCTRLMEDAAPYELVEFEGGPYAAMSADRDDGMGNRV